MRYGHSEVTGHSSDYEHDNDPLKSAEEPVPLNRRNSGSGKDLEDQYSHIYSKSDRNNQKTNKPGSDESDPEKQSNKQFQEGYELHAADTRDRALGSLEQEYPDFKVGLSPEERPINWSVTKKLAHTLAYGLTTFTAQFGASSLSPSAKVIAEKYHVGREVTVLVFSIYIIGQAVGPMIFAPLSEVAGRKIGVFIPCFIAGVIMCSAANISNVWALLVLRFVGGIFSAAPIVSSGGALGDMWKAEQRAGALALYAAAIGLGSSSSAVFGALLNETGSYGWRWTLWVSGWLQMGLPAFNMIFLSESFSPVLERSKAKMLRLETGVWALHADLDAWRLTVDEFLKVHCMRPILMFITPILFVLVLYASFVYGLMFVAITSVGVQFQKYHHFSFVASYCPLLGFFVGFVCGCCTNVVSSVHYAKYARRHGGVAPPEERLWAMMLLGWLLPFGLFFYGWTMRPNLHWFLPQLGLAFMGMGVSIIFQGSLVYMVDCYTKFAASAIASNTFMRSIFGGVMPLFSLQMYNALGPGWATSILGFVGIALWPFCFLFYRYGARLRKINPYEHLLT